MNIEPRVQRNDIGRSHRVGPKLDKQGRRRVRPIIVRFAKERTRDVFYRVCFRLKDVNAKLPFEKIFINKDLTSKWENSRHVDVQREHSNQEWVK